MKTAFSCRIFNLVRIWLERQFKAQVRLRIHTFCVFCDFVVWIFFACFVIIYCEFYSRIFCLILYLFKTIQRNTKFHDCNFAGMTPQLMDENIAGQLLFISAHLFIFIFHDLSFKIYRYLSLCMCTLVYLSFMIATCPARDRMKTLAENFFVIATQSWAVLTWYTTFCWFYNQSRVFWMMLFVAFSMYTLTCKWKSANNTLAPFRTLMKYLVFENENSLLMWCLINH